ncbi:MAG TPA: hypothetical protein PLP75_01030 [Burkholderiales bacterium]|nr:hypothetical protein [Burkholderiales bacterium]
MNLIINSLVSVITLLVIQFFALNKHYRTISLLEDPEIIELFSKLKQNGLLADSLSIKSGLVFLRSKFYITYDQEVFIKKSIKNLGYSKDYSLNVLALEYAKQDHARLIYMLRNKQQVKLVENYSFGKSLSRVMVAALIIIIVLNCAHKIVVQ